MASKVLAGYKKKEKFNKNKFYLKHSKFSHVKEKPKRSLPPSFRVYGDFTKKFWEKAKGNGKTHAENKETLKRMWMDSKAA